VIVIRDYRPYRTYILIRAYVQYERMFEDASPESRIVDALKAAGDPLERGELRNRIDLGREEFDGAFARLRGREVVRKLDGGEAFRLTYWPETRECVLCDESVTSNEYYELELEAHGASTEGELTGTLHADCARWLMDELSLADGE